MSHQVEAEESTLKTPAAVLNRRSFFGALLAIGGAGMGVLLAAPVLRFVLYPLYAKSAGIAWSDVGDIDEFSAGKEPVRKTITFSQRDGWRQVDSAQSVYVSRSSEGKFEVLSAICPHMGCSVSWQADNHKFICPCHGGEFKADGQHVSGPPPRRMDQLPAQVKDGKLQVHFKYFRSNVPNQESLS